jgi:hypothetical protein
MDTDLDSLATTLYVTVDDLLIAHPDQIPARPKVGLEPKTTDSELITLAVMAALLGFANESRWVRWAKKHLSCWFPRIPNQPGYNKRLRKLAGTMAWIQRHLAASCDQWSDGVWVVDSTPVECGRSRPTVQRSEMAGSAEYGYCASHSRFFWGVRVHLVATLAGLPIGWAATGAKADERETLLAVLSTLERRPGQTLIADKNYFGRDFEAELAGEGIVLLRKARKGEAPRPGGELFKPLRQTVESIFNTLKNTALAVERHGAHTLEGLATRVTAAVLALTAAIWHNERCGAPVLRSLTAYDH